MEKMYADLLDKPVPVFIISGLLLIAGIAALATQGESTYTESLQIILLSGELLYSLFVAALLVLVIIGWHIDDLPGKSIALAVPLWLVGSIIRLLLPFAQSAGWLGEWNGVMLGMVIVTIYLIWRVKARFAMVVILCSLYTLLVTTGFVLAFTDTVSVPIVFGIITTGAMTVALISLVYFQIKAQMRAARRDAMKTHIISGTLQSLRFIIFSGGALVLSALPLLIMGGGVFRSFGLIILIGGVVAAYTTLATPAPLILAAGDLKIKTENVRKSGKRRKS